MAEDEPEGVEGGVEGGVPGGVLGGVLGGTLGGQVGGTGTEILPFGEGMERPTVLEARPPSYTREALEAHVEGLMLVKCVITVEGRLEKCRIVKPLPHMEKAVLEALATYRYTPVTFQGRPVAVEYVIPIRLVMPKR
ncbi:MAG: energy transducer TonB [Myxococcaceae bacterium]